MSDRMTALRAAACATLLVTMLGAMEAHGRQNIVANDPITLGPAELKSPAPASAPIPAPIQTPPQASPPLATGAIDPPPAHTPPFITLPPALRGNGPLLDAKKTESAGLPIAAADSSIKSGDAATAATSLPKPPGESKPLGRANSALSARPLDEAKQTETGFLGRFDPRNNEFVRVLGALAVVIGLLLLVRTAVRRMGGGVLGAVAAQPSGVVEILAKFPVARGQQLILLKLARRIILLHQSGSSMSAITEMNDPDEVASLLARMEAGSSGRGAAKFKAALSEFEAEHQALVNDAGPSRIRRALLPEMETEIVDLTRGRGMGFGTLFGLVRRTAR